jgi:(1->4)-alpha-D-glucan 1-alpha-D-glucosylmutase
MIYPIDPAMTYLLYQTLAATCPLKARISQTYADRIAAYMLKAAREAKRYTDWSSPDQAYEAGLAGFISRILNEDDSNTDFLTDLRTFAARLAYFGNLNALAQTLIQLTAPGIPDIYQGTELCDDSLVDPDNRRPVNFHIRQRLLTEIRHAMTTDPEATAAMLFADGNPDKCKLFLIHCALRARRQNRELFSMGDYQPITFSGPFERHGVAFARSREDQWFVTVVPRFICTMTAGETIVHRTDIWQDTALILPDEAPRHWRNLLTHTAVQADNGSIPLQELFAGFPAALLKAEV